MFNPFTHSEQVRSSKSGFSLIEVMVSSTIFIFVMLSVVLTLITAQRLGMAARNRLNALQQARASLEQVVSMGYTASGLMVGAHAVSRGGFTGQYVVTEPVSNEKKQIRMTYTYPSFGRNATVELQTEVSNALH